MRAGRKFEGGRGVKGWGIGLWFRCFGMRWLVEMERGRMVDLGAVGSPLEKEAA